MRDPRTIKFSKRTPYEGVPKSFTNEEVARATA